MTNLFIGLVSIAATIFIYFMSKKFYTHFPKPFMLPILIGTGSIVCCLALFNISYETYMIGGKWIDQLLGPAVVALAYPLYKQGPVIKKYFIPILGGGVVGTFLGILTGFEFSKWLGVEDLLVYSMLPKSVTTPVAMDIAEVVGGTPALAAVFVMFAGVGGVVMAPFILKWFKINHFLGRGMGLGSASHAIGTSKALEYSEQDAAVSSIAMTLCAVLASFLGPIVVIMFG
ncbi:LrgB family protein [Bacillus taeanensis]|uniref:LrgB family protein n=1 Tax=Bacillus taeanensis TaxID=273032 RepID=A0A366Y337_9BACI|nr:LrgB family protein [Bacillus taeanensis]RBW71419.1 LrgB family protein [Bacillus taeanensis]